jgi:hypothetical protein
MECDETNQKRSGKDETSDTSESRREMQIPGTAPLRLDELAVKKILFLILFTFPLNSIGNIRSLLYFGLFSRKEAICCCYTMHFTVTLK